ncbi:unnamed protein product [Albugo candida]|uniref:Uncharacterized protein n=1 Tax=Albugo candida TaxID=65357 RepID=A0A024FTX0_9STRA|nr:unnamed protein product [Albugo candida]|eukprot:CCI10588.1 unnamed protein product [Albugo candida]
MNSPSLQVVRPNVMCVYQNNGDIRVRIAHGRLYCLRTIDLSAWKTSSSFDLAMFKLQLFSSLLIRTRGFYTRWEAIGLKIKSLDAFILVESVLVSLKLCDRIQSRWHGYIDSPYLYQ